MEKIMLSLHVLTAIVTVGPVTVAAWLFVRLARTAPAVRAATVAGEPGGGASEGHPDAAAGAGVTMPFLHRVNVVGAIVALAVPVFGFATAVQLGVLTDAWLLTAIALTAIAAAVFVWGVLARQRAALGGHVAPGSTTALVRATALFTVLWMIVVVLMVFRPGSTTGVA